MIVKFTKDILDNIEKFDNDHKTSLDVINSETEFVFSEEIRLKRINRKLEIEIKNEKGERIKMGAKPFMDEVKFELQNGMTKGRAMTAMSVGFPKLHNAILDEQKKRERLNGYINAELGYNAQAMNTTTLLGIIRGMVAYMVTDCLSEVGILNEDQVAKINDKYNYEEEDNDMEMLEDDVLLSSIKEITVGSKIQLLKSGLQHEPTLKKGMILEVTEVFKFHLQAKDELNRNWGFSARKCYKFIKLLETKIK